MQNPTTTREGVRRGGSDPQLSTSGGRANVRLRPSMERTPAHETPSRASDFATYPSRNPR